MKKLFFSLILAFLLQVPTAMSDGKHPPYLAEVVIHPENYSQTVLATLRKLGVSEEMSIIILAQAIHESDNFTSYVFENTWNPFGMRLARVRPTTRSGEFKNYSKYESLEDATIDYFYYMTYCNLPLDETNVYRYVTLLKKKAYYEDDFRNYYRAVRKHFKRINV